MRRQLTFLPGSVGGSDITSHFAGIIGILPVPVSDLDIDDDQYDVSGNQRPTDPVNVGE